jgi:hypothetical protein
MKRPGKENVAKYSSQFVENRKIEMQIKDPVLSANSGGALDPEEGSRMLNEKNIDLRDNKCYLITIIIR